jgi:hypothetical protein
MCKLLIWIRSVNSSFTNRVKESPVPLGWGLNLAWDNILGLNTVIIL